MLEELKTWLSEHSLEAAASILGLLNIYFGIKEKAVFWIFAIIGSSLYFVVYSQEKVYAFMVLQLYYIGIGIYGLYYWIKGAKNNNNEKIPVTHLAKKQIPYFIGIFVFLYVVIVFVLKLTDSEIPFIDAFITSGSVIAIYLMMKKRIEHWFVWVTLDIVTISTFIKQELYATVVLFVFYLIFAVVGYRQWKKSMLKSQT
ncbi:MAG: nicotinamide mononucleotide transporter [Bacteroidales bacterium]|nr:nicotinamide mononucleotide transporter [Bacteroidales bacterium]